MTFRSKTSKLRLTLQKYVALSAATAVLAGCASSAKDIASVYVSPLQYQSFSCDQLKAESMRIQTRYVDLGGRLDKSAENDKALMGVTLLLFWPAAFALGGNKALEAEYARLKGEYDAIQQANIQKSCSPAPGSVSAANATGSSPNSPSATAQTLVGTTFHFTDSDGISGAAVGQQTLSITRQDADGIEFNNGEYVTDPDGNVKSGRYPIAFKSLYRRTATPGESWSAEILSHDGLSKASVTVSMLPADSFALPNGNSRATVKVSLDGWATGARRGTTATGFIGTEKVAGTVRIDAASGLPLEYDLTSRIDGFSVKRKVTRIQ